MTKKKLIIILVLVVGGGFGILLLLRNVLLLSWAAYSLTEPTATPNPLYTRVQNALIRLEDLPEGVGKEKPIHQLDDDPRALYKVTKTFYGLEEWMMITHRVAVYPDPEMAQTAYQLALLQGELWRVVSSPPTLEADNLHIVCASGYASERHKSTCVVTGVYSDTLSILRVGVDDIRMTEQEFASLVVTMDYRVSSSLDSSE